MTPKIGLLPLYLELYDAMLPQLREGLAPFLKQVVDGLEREGVGVLAAPVCRLSHEVADAVADFERESVDLLVVLHLAYSPSLEAIEALRASRLPLLLLDTTMDYEFDQSVDPERLLYNHGIHGVQDLACMLRRVGRCYEIVAGHVTRSDVLSRAAGVARAARAAARMQQSRVLRIGPSFAGMGDFAVSDDLLARLGVSVTQMTAGELADPIRRIDPATIDAEMALDRQRFDVRADEAVHRRAVRVGLGLRRVLVGGNFSALSANFLAFDSADGPVDTVPFLEISKAMSRGLGYAGEGDVLTAALVGALRSGWPRTTFTEIFCPDWKGGSLFLSHMGELNPDVAAARPTIVEKPFPFTAAQNPAVLTAAIAGGPALFVNLAPGPEDTLRLIVAPVQMLGDGTHPDVGNIIRGWMKPHVALDEFLERFSRLGGTHHSGLVLGERVESLEAFARFIGVECCVIS